MKQKVFFLSFAIICISFFSFAQNKQFAVKSGYIEYQLTGSTTGTKSVWWDNYGVKKRTETKAVTETKVFGMSSKTEENSITISDGKMLYSWDTKTKTGQKSSNQYGEMADNYTKDMTEAEQKKMADDLLASLGGEKLGTEKVLGKQCEVIQVLGTKSWIYNGVILKTESKLMMINSTEVATKFNENVSVPNSKFMPDKGISFTDVDAEQAKAFAEMDMSDLGNDDQQDDDDDDEIVPVKYPYDSFSKVIKNFKYKDFNKMIQTSQMGQHMAMFNSGANVLSILATSRKNADIDPTELKKSAFKHNGKTCYFYEEDDENASSLIVDYPTYDMYILFVGKPKMTKDELLKIYDSAKF